MKKKVIITYYVASFVFGFDVASCQNLVPNGGFEVYSQCPKTITEFLRFDVQAWLINKTTGTCDYYNSCSQTSDAGTKKNFMGSQHPKEGNGYAGFIASEIPESGADTIHNFGERVQVKLLSPLLEGRYYCVSYWLSLADRSDYAISGIDALLTKKRFKIHSEKLYNKQKAINAQIMNGRDRILASSADWMQVCGYLKAQGGERYLTIGKFSPIHTMKFQYRTRTGVFKRGGFNDANETRFSHCYYYIDDISVAEVQDTLKCICTENSESVPAIPTVATKIIMPTIEQKYIIKNFFNDSFDFDSIISENGLNRLKEIENVLIQDSTLTANIYLTSKIDSLKELKQKAISSHIVSIPSGKKLVFHDMKQELKSNYSVSIINSEIDLLVVFSRTDDE